MDEDLSVKAAPVTRLRKRLSVDAEDSPLPTTPSTPTKKRTTRLAAKPQLELIDEVVPENVPKKATRKAAAAVKESIDTEAITGTSTPVTPSRRSTRIKSNTSILSETTSQSVESPRAKRALRRKSQLGSDTESAAVTPARQTRRTIKNSTTSIDKPGSDTESAAVTPAKQTRQTKNSTTSDDVPAGDTDKNVAVSIVTSTNSNANQEEPDRESTSKNGYDVSPSTRKSPRLNKNGNKSDETDNVNKEIDKNPMNSSEEYTENTDKYAPGELTTIKSDMVEIKNGDDTTPKDNEKQNLSTSSFNPMSNIKTYIKKTKSTSSVEKITNDLLKARPRTKSWTTLTSPSNVHEGAKVKQNKTISSMSGSGDGLLNNENECETDTVSDKNVNSPNRSVNNSKLFMLNTFIENKENLESLDQFAEFEMNKSKSDTAKLFENSPANQKALVLIDDCDSCSEDKFSINIKMEGDDQSVPIVANPTSESTSKCNQSVEPMDIDESMPGSVTILDIDDFSDKSNISKEEEVPDKKTSITEKCLVKNISNSRRKSSISQSEISNSSTPKRISISEDDINKSIKNSSNSVQEKFNDRVKEEPIRILSSTQVADEEVYNESSKLRVSGEENMAKQNGESLNKSLKKSSISINRDTTENPNESSNKSTKEKLSISHGIQKYFEQHNDDRKSPNKPEKTSSDSQTELSNLEKSGNENKSTLVISQLKDIPAIDTNNAMSPNHTNELSKSMDGPDVKNKGIDRKIYSLKENNIVNYLTSTPIQEKPVQNLTMQINTSIISPAVENKNKTSEKVPQKGMEASDSDSSDEKTGKKTPQKSISNKTAKKSVVAPKKKLTEAPSSYESSDYETEAEAEPKTETKTVVKKSPSTKKPDLDSSNSESETELRCKSKIIKSPNKKAPALECSDTEERESKTEQKTLSKIDIKKVPNIESSDSDVESETATKTQIKIDNKKVPALDSPDSSEEELDSKNQQNKKTPINELDSESKSESKAKTKKNKAPSKKYPTSDSSDSDSSEEDVSKDKSKIFDDEASDAGDNYESGDSQDEEDRCYEAENEIAVKGETLDSEEEFSNDSDYENDSFVVDSDAEDEDLLSGTGDDLSMSDNGLTMSSKSKKKYNERKLKQQKKASREMYEARHKNESADSLKPASAKPKKPKRQRLESSTQESENENTQRLRTDSNQDSIIKSESDKSVGIKKKKSKRLSESVCDITINEKEITILNEGTENKDPLSVAIKQEPKTPQRKFNMSTISIHDKIEEIQVDANASIMRENGTLDPLEATMAANDEKDSSSSDNMEIIENYESVLNNLSSQTKKVKTVDTSLNLNKKVKDSKEPIMDQLNLTQTKKSKKDKNKTAENNPTESIKSKSTDFKLAQKEDDSSDSIDMKLLFPEDSNDSDIHASQFKPKAKGPEEDFIPLKRTEAKTNLHENSSMNISLNESALNTSKKKNKKRKSSQCIPEEEYMLRQPVVSEEPEDSGFKIIMDTTGTYDDNESHNSSKKKKNKKNKSLNEDGIKFIMDTTVMYEDDIPQPHNSSKKKKNKKNKSLNEESALDVDCTDGAPDIPIEVSFTSEKKNKSFNVSANNIEKSFIVESHSEKKSKKKSDSTSEFVETLLENPDNTSVDVIPLNVSVKSDKKNKKNKTDVSLTTESVVETMSDNTKKKSKKTQSAQEMAPQMTVPEPSIEPAETSISSEKKKKKKKKKNKESLDHSLANMDYTGEESDDAPMEMSYKSEKKSDATVTDDAVTSTEKNKRKKNKKKKNKNKNLSQSSDKSVENVTGQNDGTQKRKRKASYSPPDTEDANSILSGNLTSYENKKRKILLDDECISAYNDNEQSNSKKSKKNKSKNYVVVEQGEVLQQNSKKRKYRDDDDPEDKNSKVIKQSSFDKIHVPKLPESIINQLSDKPQNKISKTKNTKVAIATMPFVVEEAERRKNKPSNYLEQSVYINEDDDSPVKKKQKRSKHKKPKVLPFIPTAVISESGYTSKFNINVLPKEAQFVAQASNAENFRESFLGSQRIKKMGTLERCKIQRSHKISKF